MTSTAATLADQYWEFQLEHRHFANLARGELSRLEQWDDLSAEGLSSSRKTSLGFARSAAQVTSEDASDRILAETVAAIAFMDATVSVWWPQLQAANFQVGLLSSLLPALHLQPLVTADHGRRYLDKLSRFPAMIDQLVDPAGGRRRHRGGAPHPPRAPDHRETRPDPHPATVGRPDRHPARSAQLGPVEANRWRASLPEAIETAVRPGLARFQETLNEVTLPAGRPDSRAGLCHLPGGEGGVPRHGQGPHDPGSGPRGDPPDRLGEGRDAGGRVPAHRRTNV